MSSSPKPSLAAVFRLVAENSPSSLRRAIAAAEPGSAAARYFSAMLLSLRAFVDAGGLGVPRPFFPLGGGGVGFCAHEQGHAICDHYQQPSFASDGRLSGFTVNGVDVARLVRLGTGIPAAPLVFADGLVPSARVVALLRDPLERLNVVVQVENDSDAPHALPNGLDFSYRRDGSGVSVRATSYATPASVARQSSVLLDLVFYGANFGGTVVLPDGGLQIHIPGPPVALPNAATVTA